MYIGIGIPVPVIDEEMVEFLSVKDEDIYTEIFDYSVQRRNKPSYGKINYRQLRSGTVELKGKKVFTGSLSSYKTALEIADVLKSWIIKKSFYLTSAVCQLPSEQRVNVLNVLSEDEL